MANMFDMTHILPYDYENPAGVFGSIAEAEKALDDFMERSDIVKQKLWKDIEEEKRFMEPTRDDLLTRTVL